MTEEQLKADRLELAEKIVENCTVCVDDDYEYCVFCSESGEHEYDCIVLKAEKIIKEIDN